MVIPVLLTKKCFLFPNCESYLMIEGESIKKDVLLRSWKEHNGHLLIYPISPDSSKKENKKEKNSHSEDSNFELFKIEKEGIFQEKQNVGILAKIAWGIDSELSEDSLEELFSKLKKIKLRGLARVRLTNVSLESDVWVADYEVLGDVKEENQIRELTAKFTQHLPDIIDRFYSDSKLSSYQTIFDSTDLSQIMDSIVQNSGEIDDLTKYKILIETNLSKRLEILIDLPLNTTTQKKIDVEINNLTKNKIKKEQEEYSLVKKKEAIEKRLRELRGSNSLDEEIHQYVDRVNNEPYPQYIKDLVSRKVRQYESNPPNSAEAAVIKNYISWLVELPWWQTTKESDDLELAKKKLDDNHYGLTQVKERIIEYLAARQKAHQELGQILCLVGSPGVGKTSLAASIAEATGRKFVKMSVSGITDTATILGHRITYVGSTPGKIIELMRKSQVINPVFLIDEIDKIGHSVRGDPAYALLSILDTTQNDKFTDEYLETEYDLSKVFFITTANYEEDIPPSLYDRLEVIYIPSYSETEKEHIAKEYIIPKIINQYNLEDTKIEFRDEAIMEMIRYYTREAGVRELNRLIETVVRKCIYQLQTKNQKHYLITSDNIKEYLKERKFDFSIRIKNDRPGRFNAVGWTESGGTIIPVEVSYYQKKEESDPAFTGNLEKATHESGVVAYNYVRTNCHKFGIDPDFFSKNSVHVHMTGGSPKDGPSAGVSLTTAIISAITSKVISENIVATGEITLHGNVGAIGGLREKATGSYAAGMEIMFVPAKNKRDINEIPEEVRNKLKIIPVSNYEEVWNFFCGKNNKTVTSTKGRTKRVQTE